MIRDHCSRDMDIEYPAHPAGYSQQHFMRKFKEINGCTVGQVITLHKKSEIVLPIPQVRRLSPFSK